MTDRAAHQVNIHEAKSQLSKLLARAEAGEDVVIARAGRPIARLVPIRSRRPIDFIGCMRGRIEIPDDFDATDTEIERMFGYR